MNSVGLVSPIGCWKSGLSAGRLQRERVGVVAAVDRILVVDVQLDDRRVGEVDLPGVERALHLGAHHARDHQHRLVGVDRLAPDDAFRRVIDELVRVPGRARCRRSRRSSSPASFVVSSKAKVLRSWMSASSSS